MASPGHIPPGTRLGPYEIEAHIGAGGMGDVYRARDTRLDRHVALKTSREKYSERFEREMRAIAALSHPNVCALYDVGPDYLVMEMLEGQTLASVLESRRPSAEEAVQIATQVAEALDAAHGKGIVHRDIKPGNVFLSPKGHVKVLDFGLAKLATPSFGDDTRTVAADASHLGTTMGTVAYMSPEQARGEEVDARSDLWSLGVVLHEMLTGARPFLGTTHATTFDAILNKAPAPPEADVELQRVVGKLLEKDRSLRYQSAAEVVVDLKRIQRSGTGSASVQVPAAVRGKRRWVPIAAALAAPALIGGGAWYWRGPATPMITSSDTIVVAEFVNKTGDPVFDGTLREALSTKLEQSNLVRPMSPGAVQNQLELMRLDPATVVTPEIARQICVRAGEKATLEGSIAALGTSYALNLSATNCQTGDVLAASQAQAAGKEAVLNVLSAAVDEIRQRLGEELANTERPGVRESLALTTASLEAYQSYTRGIELFRRERRDEAYPHFQRAHEIDPNFAWAYAAQAVSTRDPKEQKELYEEAYRHRQSASMAERLTIEFEYARGVERDLEKARRLGEETLQIAPHTGAVLNDLANVYRALGDLRRATELREQLLQDLPDFALSYYNLARDYATQGRLNDARAVLDKARDAQLEQPFNQQLRAMFAYAEGDPATAEKESAKLPAGVNSRLRTTYLLSLGRLREAEELRSSTGTTPALTIDAHVAFEDCRGVAEVTSPFLLSCGDQRAAEAAESRLANPDLADAGKTALEAVVALGRGDARKAADTVRPRAEKEFPDPEITAVYAMALRRLNQPARAADALRKITSNPAYRATPDFPRAQVDLARALAAAGDTAGAKQAYEAFFEFWKGADADVPLLVNARREYAALQ